MARTLAQDRYRILELLGSGTFAEVWAVLDRRLEVERAVKVLRADVDPSLGAQLSREARVLARISHPAVVHVYDVFTDTVDGAERTCVVMEKCDESLGDRVVRDGPIPEAQALAWFDALADGLAKAHALGVIHRDVKPHNILLVAGEARLADFGLALLGSSVDVVTRTSAVVGTVAFMAEAVRKGEAHTPETDRYGLAASLVYAVTGKLPGDLLRAGNRAGLSEAVRARVEAWVGGVETPVVRSPVRGPGIRRGLVLAGLVASGVVGGVGVYTLAPRTVDPLDAVIPGWSALPDCGLDLKFGRREKYPRWETDPELPREGWSVAVGDFNGDGRKDVAVGYKIGSGVGLFLNDGTGIFAGKGQLSKTGAVHPEGLSAGDVDNDGADEILIRSGDDGSLSMLDLRKDEWPQDILTTGMTSSAVLARMDDDSCADLVYMAGSEVLYRKSGCDGGFRQEVVLSRGGVVDIAAARGHKGIFVSTSDSGVQHWTTTTQTSVWDGPPVALTPLGDLGVVGVQQMTKGVGGDKTALMLFNSKTPCLVTAPGNLTGLAASAGDIDGDGLIDWITVRSAPYSSSSVTLEYGISSDSL